MWDGPRRTADLDSEPEAPEGTVERWLRDLEEHLHSGSADLQRLFEPSGLWKDLFALDSQPLLLTVGAGEAPLPAARLLRNWRVSATRTAPRLVDQAGTALIEAFVEFDLPGGGGEGVVRLVRRSGTVRALELMTSLSTWDGAPETVGPTRPGYDDDRPHDFAAPTWYERRAERARFEDRDPEVLVIGAGQAGLALAARLGRLGVDTLVVERNARIGDNWRHRYRSLRLHNATPVIGLPYFPCPPSWETYLSKDRVADWLEYYADALDIACWTSTELESATRNGSVWHATVRTADGSRRVLRTRHLVLATGASGRPRLPALRGLSAFHGPLLHSTQYRDGSQFGGQHVLVIGTGSSGHDIAQDLHAHGATVTMLQRGPVTVAGVQSIRRILDRKFEELPQSDADLIAASFPLPSYLSLQQEVTRQLRAADAELLAGLAAAGFQVDFGEDETGPALKYLRRAGGFYLNVGCSDLIAAGEVTVMSAGQVGEVIPAGIRLIDGQVARFDTIIAATGFEPPTDVLKRTLGEDVAERVGAVWGLDEVGHPRNVWRPTAVEGLWFMLGNIQQCRFYSKLLALQLAVRLRPRGLAGSSQSE